MMNKKTPNVKLFRRPHQSDVYAPDRAPRREPMLMSETRIDDLVAAIEYPLAAVGSGSPKRRKKSSKIRMPLI
jgi:hypothetical protein